VTEVTGRLKNALAGRYRLERELGQGGMATVYLAHDLRHDRYVALKVLRPELAALIGAERFLKEIKVTANLQHPHILGLIDSGEVDGILYYVMPSVEGESLRDRLNREKQLPIADAVRIATEVASALDYAHRHHVIHRDIKPENILIHDGRAMVADFGIALAVSTAGGTRMTETGMSLGTPHYMSPEQAMGEREVTARSDIYALGAVLYEMLVGEPPFTGPTAQAIVARVMTEQPRNLTLQRRTIPPQVEAAVQTALEKLPADRFASAREFAEALQATAESAKVTPQRTTVPPMPRLPRWRDPAVLIPSVVAVAALAAAAVVARRREPATVPPIRFILSATDSARPGDGPPWPAAISPDGSAVVYFVAQGTTSSMFYLLRTDQLEPHPIPGTTNGYQPYFSPDGTWLGFEAAGKERKVRLDGSAPVTITDASSGNGVDWTANNEIVLGANGNFHGLSRVSAAGGDAVELTRPDTVRGERDHLWPIAAPDGKTIVFVTWSGALAGSRLAITSVDDGKVVPLGIPGIRPLAMLDGMLVYVQADGTVMAVKLDLRGKKIAGRPIPVHDPVQVQPWANGNSGVFISHGGALVASRGGARGTLTWLSRNGVHEQVVPQPREFEYPRLSPDERRISVVVRDGQRSDVWIYDRTLATFSRLTSAETVTAAEWNSNGTRIVFTAASEARSAVWSQIAAGGSPAERLFESRFLISAVTMSPDGQWLLVQTFQNTWDIMRVHLDSAPQTESYLTSPANELAPTFSPDGKWAAVVSDESGRPEVYVRSFPDPSSRIQISVAGGGEPVWSRDGSRLYYRAGGALLAARISLAPAFTLLSRDTIVASLPASASRVSDYDVTRDGRRILAVLPDADDFRLVVSPNWITELRRRVAESSQGN